MGVDAIWRYSSWCFFSRKFVEFVLALNLSEKWYYRSRLAGKNNSCRTSQRGSERP
jgi:hypothetical protein